MQRWNEVIRTKEQDKDDQGEGEHICLGAMQVTGLMQALKKDVYRWKRDACALYMWAKTEVWPSGTI